MIGLYTLQIYVFGAKFAGAVAALSRAAPAPRPAPPPAPVVPGVVSVQILHEDKAK